MRKGSLVKQINDALNALIHFDGVDKYANKKEVLRRMIVSRRTLEAYKRECCAFAKWVRTRHPSEGVNTLERLRPYAVEYLHRSKPNGENYSAWTLRLERSAIAKLYGVSCNEICADLPTRRRVDIKRSRGVSTRGGTESLLVPSPSLFSSFLLTLSLKKPERGKKAHLYLPSTPFSPSFPQQGRRRGKRKGEEQI